MRMIFTENVSITILLSLRNQGSFIQMYDLGTIQILIGSKIKQ